MPKRKPKPVRVGRPSQFTDENQKVILKAVGLGCSYVDSCRCARISYETFRGWMAEGRRDSGARKRSAFAAFFEDIKKAEADFKFTALEGIKAAASTTWTAFAWLLERKFPDEFGLQRNEIRQLNKLADEQSKRIAELEAKLAAGPVSPEAVEPAAPAPAEGG